MHSLSEDINATTMKLRIFRLGRYNEFGKTWKPRLSPCGVESGCEEGMAGSATSFFRKVRKLSLEWSISGVGRERLALK